MVTTDIFRLFHPKTSQSGPSVVLISNYRNSLFNMEKNAIHTKTLKFTKFECLRLGQRLKTHLFSKSFPGCLLDII